MLIRSQDKKALCNYNGGVIEMREKYDREIINCTYVPVETGEYNIFFCNCDEIHIGTYSNEEKAIKVLDMICEKYQEPICENEIEDYVKLTYKNIIFQMPQDEDV